MTRKCTDLIIVVLALLKVIIPRPLAPLLVSLAFPLPLASGFGRIWPRVRSSLRYGSSLPARLGRLCGWGSTIWLRDSIHFRVRCRLPLRRCFLTLDALHLYIRGGAENLIASFVPSKFH